MTLENLVSDSFTYNWLMPIMVAVLCVFTNRLNGRTENSCPTWKDKFQLGFIYMMCLFMNLFFIWLLLMFQESWLALKWNIIP